MPRRFDVAGRQKIEDVKFPDCRVPWQAVVDISSDHHRGKYPSRGSGSRVAKRL